MKKKLGTDPHDAKIRKRTTMTLSRVDTPFKQHSLHFEFIHSWFMPWCTASRDLARREVSLPRARWLPPRSSRHR